MNKRRNNFTFKLNVQKNIKKTAGFTLIEMLVVISIIAFLAVVAVVSLQNARAKSRDSQRLANINQLQKAVELYYGNNGSIPGTASYGEAVGNPLCTGGWDCSYEDQDGLGDGAFMEFLKTSNVMATIPVDPLNDSSHYYRYYYYSGTGLANGCERPYYVIQALGLETAAGTNDDVCYTVSKGSNSVYTVIGSPK